ncbi:AAA family ATPase [uncultured Clostridium sp.]|uniref:AAA family ATPase n=1 Tax=uncultured Clostridium sp. TaxID=59620 RepID=UPI002625E232|nr:AAA family ATPase [uncultured Clostridium sp.]
MNKKDSKVGYYLILENIQSIKYAKIGIGGISALTGDNNLGKSTVNKVLFALVNASEKLIETRDNEYIKNLVSSYFDDEIKVNKVLDKLYGKDIKLDESEFDVYDRTKVLIALNDVVSKNTTFSTELLKEIPHPIIRKGCNEGKIKLFDVKQDKYIYDATLMAFDGSHKEKYELIDNTYSIIDDLFAIKEELNELSFFKYKKTVYIDASDLMILTPVWGELLREDKIRESIKQTINMMMKFSDLKEMGFDSLVYLNNKLMYKVISKEGVPEFLDINSVGDGYKRIALLNSTVKYINEILIKKERETLFLIEEPEIGVHPKRIEEIAKIIRTAGIDIVFTTHDSLLVNMLMEDMDVFKATVEEEGVINDGTNIELVDKAEDILMQYLEPLTEFRKAQFEKILE